MIFPLQAFQAVSSANPWTYVVFGVIGFAFGYALEISGFGNSKKLAAQFYFRDLTVLKVMFTAIIVSMVLLYGAAAIGLLDLGLVWINPTYLGSGVVGGLIMGVGFIVGGFCPGTSVAGAATGKIDAMVYLVGGLFGAWLFGETEHLFDNWYNTAGYFGRLTLPEVFGLPAGIVVTLVVLMALFMFWGGEHLERLFGQRDLNREPKLRVAGAGLLVALAAGIALMGEPSQADKLARIVLRRTQMQDTGSTKDGARVLAAVDVAFSPAEALDRREFFASPVEILQARYDQALEPVLIDVRTEAEFNLFHIQDAANLPGERVVQIAPQLLAEAAPNRVVVLMGNGEAAATDAWKALVAAGVPNVYILQGGINNWIATFGVGEPGILRAQVSDAADTLGYLFPAALGARYQAADPDPDAYESLQFTPKIQLQLKRDKSGGGCG